eukprot:1034250-Amphidinium_carterae.1
MSEDHQCDVMREWKGKGDDTEWVLLWRYKLRSLQPGQLQKWPSWVRSHRVRMLAPSPRKPCTSGEESEDGFGDMSSNG